MSLTIGTAAKLAGVSKSTIKRRIKSGQLCAARKPNGEYVIEHADLSRTLSEDSSGMVGAEQIRIGQQYSGTVERLNQNVIRSLHKLMPYFDKIAGGV